LLAPFWIIKMRAKSLEFNSPVPESANLNRFIAHSKDQAEVIQLK
jgi:uncharacterized membrane protein